MRISGHFGTDTRTANVIRLSTIGYVHIENTPHPDQMSLNSVPLKTRIICENLLFVLPSIIRSSIVDTG